MGSQLPVPDLEGLARSRRETRQAVGAHRHGSLRRPLGRLAAAVVALALGLGSGVVSAKPPPMPKDSTARKHFDAAIELYKAEDFEASIAEAKAGIAIEEHESLLFILAQAERQSGKCIDAVDTFTRFIELTENDDMKQNALMAKAMCAEELAEMARQAEIAAKEAEEAEEAEPEPEPEPPPPPPPKPFYIDPLGDSLIGVGGAAVIAGGALLIVGATIHPEDEMIYEDFETAAARKKTMYIAGGVTLGVGAALAAGGVAVLLLKKKKMASAPPAAARVQMAPWLDPRRAGVVLRARF